MTPKTLTVKFVSRRWQTFLKSVSVISHYSYQALIPSGFAKFSNRHLFSCFYRKAIKKSVARNAQGDKIVNIFSVLMTSSICPMYLSTVLSVKSTILALCRFTFDSLNPRVYRSYSCAISFPFMILFSRTPYRLLSLNPTWFSQFCLTTTLFRTITSFAMKITKKVLFAYLTFKQRATTFPINIFSSYCASFSKSHIAILLHNDLYYKGYRTSN